MTAEQSSGLKKGSLRLAALCIAIIAPAAPGRAQSFQAEQCRIASNQAERSLHIPDGFLYAISRVESGKTDAQGHLSAWPWTIMANGVGHYYDSKQEAITAATEFRKEGVLSIDVGCLQVNLQQHPDAFPTLDQAFDPMSNALYAGRFLTQMHDKMGSWPRAAAAYHSQTPGLGTPYQWKVLETWAIPDDEQVAPVANQKRPLRGAPVAVPEKTRSQSPYGDAILADAGEGSRPVVKAFHPFQGFSHFTQPPLHRSGMNGMKGRSLASYRSMPTQLARPTG
ncbi:lytic transglycosylase domain-containing protein [Asaia sp. W19]|uniref:transglycosylase SLT domain-containing protein n=1 Tax=unclassified Asaia TaxID=2685023 RepID=UPI000F8C493D|nr:transglycosylase SLT domain-containing protein [Asaia sp. W19]RUT26213.1 lytic transglycosylase domain-containing protein [Asaia sp. W19]